MCYNLCEADSANNAYFGTQFEHECWCGDASTDVEKNGAAITTCNKACRGDANEICGGRDAISAYQINDVAVVIGENYNEHENDVLIPTELRAWCVRVYTVVMGGKTHCFFLPPTKAPTQQ